MADAAKKVVAAVKKAAKPKKTVKKTL